MGHEIDTTEGVSSYADSRVDRNGRVDAWHKLGTAVGHAMTPDEALDAAHMRGWDVRKVPLTATFEETTEDAVRAGRLPGIRTMDVPNKFLTVRTNPVTKAVEPLGVVGRVWAPFQNEQTTALLGDITEASGGHIETLGALDGGRRTFVTMRMPSWMEFTVPGSTGLKDISDLYLSIFNWHDGGGSLVANISAVRVVCANTQRIAESSAVSRVALRHTGNPTARMAEVRNLLGLTFAYRDTYVEICEQAIAKQVDTVQVMDVINDVWRVEGAQTEKQSKGRKRIAASVFDVYQTSETVKPFYGTAWGAYNAVTEYFDHIAPVVGGSKATAEEAAIKRAHRTLTDDGMGQRKAEALTKLLAV